MKIKSTLLTFVIICTKLNTLFAQVNTQDSLALVDLYNSSNGAGWGHHDNWLTTQPVSTWYGITVADNRVTEISLYTNNLTGTIPTSIGNLTQLDILFLGNNVLSGSIPSSIHNLTNLTDLSLEYNQLTGSIPSSIGKLTQLTYLYLNNNQLTGNMPSSMGNFINLHGLYLNNNQLSGSIPASIGKLTSIDYELDLSFNQFTGSIPPELSNLTNISYLYLNDNQLSGTIPKQLANLQNLVYLWLQDNQLTGSIPKEIGSISTLSILWLNSNKLSGNIPTELGNLYSLSFSLDLSFNQLTGSIPPELGNLNKLKSLKLNNNLLTGDIPPEFGKLTVIYYLYLNDNQLSGTIPQSFGRLNYLHDLRLGNNKLYGNVPLSLNNCKRLRVLLIDSNRLSGNIYNPISNLNLLALNFSHNHFTFDGTEQAIKKFPFAVYGNQLRIPVHLSTNSLYVSAGGTLSNNIYRWYTVGKAEYTEIKGDSVYYPTQSGTYYAKISNTVCTHLVLSSDTLYCPITSSANSLAVSSKNELQSANSVSNFIMYPNPAKNIVYVQTNSNASFTLVNQSGKVLFITNVNQMSSINLSYFANGVYYIKNNTTGKVKKLVIEK